MISINKQGNAIVIEFTDNDKYLFNGTIEVAPNELMIVIDESNMATFKRSTNGDTLFSQLINKIQIGGTNVTKDTILDEFAKIGFAIGGSVNSVNGQTGDVIITASNVGAYSKNEVDNLLNSKANSADVYTKTESDAKYLTEHQSLADYATKSEIPTATSQLTNDSGFITEIPSEYITETELTSSLSTKADSANVYTKAEINNMIGDIGTRLDQINGEVI